MANPAIKAEFNRILNTLVRLRDQYDVYDDDWDTTPTAVKAKVRTRVSTVVSQASADLAALSAAIQAQQ